MEPSLEQLRTFLAVLDTGTFDAAARRLRVTPSAISQRIRGLEDSVGRVLLTRTRPIAPTTSGEIVLRLARQMALLEAETTAVLHAMNGGPEHERQVDVVVPLVINADSLATWALAPLASVDPALGARFEVLTEDEGHSVDLLRSGEAMAAITSVATAVQGCSVSPLGTMRYRPMASPAFARTWFPDGLTEQALSRAPVLTFDTKDRLQSGFIRSRVGRDLDPPRHLLPASREFADAVALGLGWAMLPDLQTEGWEQKRMVVDLAPGAFADVRLFWQRWRLDSPVLSALTTAFDEAAGRSLRR